MQVRKGAERRKLLPKEKVENDRVRQRGTLGGQRPQGGVAEGLTAILRSEVGIVHDYPVRIGAGIRDDPALPEVMFYWITIRSNFPGQGTAARVLSGPILTYSFWTSISPLRNSISRVCDICDCRAGSAVIEKFLP